MLPGQTPDPVRQQALAALISQFVQQGHPNEYAKFMAMSTVFQVDLELRNAQLARLLGWIQQEHPELHQEATKLVESTRAEFEKRVQA
ncbi:MAG: hypothetical protein F6K09_26655 [Merismopedia sp. SIO2A8]|nr:hypothetical protein [Merismopedia sp. SIO2A8]